MRCRRTTTHWTCSTKPANIEIDNAEPEIGTIDQFINEDIEIDIEAIAAPENKPLDDEAQAADSDSFESALINYPNEDDDEQVLEQEAESNTSSEATDTNDSPTNEAPETPNDLAADSDEASIIPEPASHRPRRHHRRCCHAVNARTGTAVTHTAETGATEIPASGSQRT